MHRILFADVFKFYRFLFWLSACLLLCGTIFLLLKLFISILRYWKSTIKGADNGKLSGKKIAIKDNVMVAGVPMMNGCRSLEGIVPDVDATVVTRLLDAGKLQKIKKTHSGKNTYFR